MERNSPEMEELVERLRQERDDAQKRYDERMDEARKEIDLMLQRSDMEFGHNAILCKEEADRIKETVDLLNYILTGDHKAD